MLKFLGRGSAFNTKEGNTSAYYITKNNNLILFDCGSTVFQKLQEKNLINGRNRIIVLVTHLHSDHIGSLSTLIEYCYYVLKNKVEVIYPDTYSITKVINLLGVYQSMYKVYDIKEEQLKFIQLHYDQQITLRMVPMFHVEKFLCCAYLLYFEETNTAVYYSGDTNAIHSNLDMLMKCLELPDKSDKNLIIYHDICLADYDENVHTPLRFLKEIIPEDKRKYVYCMHIDNNDIIPMIKDAGFNIVEIDE